MKWGIPLSSNDDFFADVQSAGALKHGILRRYPTVFASKAGASQVAEGRVTLVDGYAGAGSYGSGAPGSPLLLREAAARVAAMKREVECVFIESDSKSLSLLEGQDWGDTRPTILSGRCEEHLEQVLANAEHRALLVFLDPFGMAISFDSVANVILQRKSRAPVEVLLHFSMVTTWRTGPAALSPKVPEANARVMGDQLDEFVGGGWWRDIMGGDAAPSIKALEVSDEYARRVREVAGCRSITIDVRSRPSTQPIYRLILFTYSGHGTWAFADAAGHAHIDWLEHLGNEDFEKQRLAASAKRQALRESGVMSFFDDAPELEPAREVVDRAAIEAMTEATYVPVIEANLRRLLKERAAFRLRDETEVVYGAALGRGREKHVRAAIARLVADGLVVPDGGSKLANVTLLRP